MNGIRIEATNKVLSANGGLIVQKKIVDSLNLEKRLGKILPALKGKGKGEQWDKVHCLLMAFILGADCLEDVGYYFTDPAFQKVCKVPYAPNTLGEFLRSFDKNTSERLSTELLKLALRLRFSIKVKQKAKDKKFILCLDSTKHEHCGQKIEGLEWTHDGKWCLDSLQAYDDLGFQYFFDLRPGATNTAAGAPEAITKVFHAVKQADREQKLILLADSGYCSYNIFNTCFHAGAKFVISLRQQLFNKYAHQIENWKTTKIKSHDGRACEIGSTVFFREGTFEPLRIVALRAKKIDGMLEGYDIFDFVTNMGLNEISNEKLVMLYRTRANSENFLKEAKGGFDLKHFPCQKMIANKAYGLIGGFAYNVMRFSALMEDPLHPKFAKLLRFRMVKLACEVVTHSRVTTFRFMQHTAQEVIYWIDKIHTYLNGGVFLVE